MCRSKIEGVHLPNWGIEASAPKNGCVQLDSTSSTIFFHHNKSDIPVITQDFPLTKKLSAEDLT